jgi:hypothetical protein
VEPTAQPKIEVVITEEGVEVVSLYGTSWADEDAAVTLFRKLSPFLRQVREFLTYGARFESRPS